MVKDLSALYGMEYPGRVIIIGQSDQGVDLVAYGLSGRSDSSKARRLVENAGDISIDVTDKTQLEKGDPALLVYNAVVQTGSTTIVSNGAQTDEILKIANAYELAHNGKIPIELLLPLTFSRTHNMQTKDGREIDTSLYEPDDPNFTPRVSGVVQGDAAMLSVLKRDANGERLANFYQFPLVKGEGKLIATYDGINQNPLPAYNGEPRAVGLHGTIEEIATQMYDSMGEFKVSTAVVGVERNNHRCSICNLHK